jgi:hypothetical protein
MADDYEEKNATIPSFTPETNITKSVVEARAKVAGSHYGKEKVVLPPKKEEERPTFKPEMQRSKSGVALASNAVSSYYGTVVPDAPPKKEAERPSFKPDLSDLPESVQKAKEAARSSKYGTVIPSPPVYRPYTAPVVGQFESSHTLLADRSLIEEDTERPKSPQLNLVADHFHPLKSPFKAKPFPESPANIAAKSSAYGKIIPEVAKQEKIKTFTEMMANPIRECPINGNANNWKSKAGKDFDEFEPIKVPAKVNDLESSKYGVESPKKGEKLQVASELPWAKLSRQSSLVDLPEDLPTVGRNSLTDQVESSLYGQVPPVPAERRGSQLEGTWRPPTLAPMGALPNPPESPRNTNFDHIQSYYGRSYSPGSSLRMTDEE